MYLKNEHFKQVIDNYKTNYEDYKGLDFTRLSSKAMKAENNQFIMIIYINTIVLIYNKTLKKTILNTNGWQTMTSKKWINHGLALTGFDHYIMQKDFKWFIVDGRDGTKPRDYRDGIELKTK